MNTSRRIDAYALELFDAERSRTTIPQITARDQAFSVDDAYAVQLTNINKAIGLGFTVSGKKIGLTSLAMQKQLGVGEPDYGHLFHSMDCSDGAGGGDVDTGDLIQPKIEAEIAFVLKKELSGGNVTPDDVSDATDYVVAAFEIVDSRIENWKLKLADTVADNASSGRYILGADKVSLGGNGNANGVGTGIGKSSDAGDCVGIGADTAKSSDAGVGTGIGKSSDAGAGKCAGANADLPNIAMRMYKKAAGCEDLAGGELAGEELVGEGRGSDVMGDPRVAVAWLANKLWSYGVTLNAGEVILSGAFSAAPAAKKGDVFRAEFDGIGKVEARFI